MSNTEFETMFKPTDVLRRDIVKLHQGLKNIKKDLEKPFVSTLMYVEFFEKLSDIEVQLFQMIADFNKSDQIPPEYKKVASTFIEDGVTYKRMWNILKKEKQQILNEECVCEKGQVYQNLIISMTTDVARSLRILRKGLRSQDKHIVLSALICIRMYNPKQSGSKQILEGEKQEI